MRVNYCPIIVQLLPKMWQFFVKMSPSCQLSCRVRQARPLTKISIKTVKMNIIVVNKDSEVFKNCTKRSRDQAKFSN